MENSKLRTPSSSAGEPSTKNKTNPSSNRKGGFLWYPFLFAVYPVLGLLAHNIGQARPEAAVRPALADLAAAALLLGLFRLLLKDWQRAAFITSVWMGLFAAYGHVYTYLLDAAPTLARTDVLGGSALLLGALALFAASRPKVRFDAWTAPLNAAALALIILPLGQVVWYEIDVRGAPEVRAGAPTVEVTGPQPDIYYIVLDMYTRSDTLRTAYGYDNSAFLSDLKEMGFNVAECSMSNYVRTELSLSSSLNMDYLTSELNPAITPESEARSPLWNLIRNNRVMEYAQARGYKTVAFATGFPWSELDNADVYLEADPLRGGMTEFESLWLETTAFRILEDEGVVNTRVYSFNRYRERTQFTLDTLPTLATMEGPKFVFAHLILPHPPFVFAEDGGRTDAVSFLNEKAEYPADKFEQGYLMQLTFANHAITDIVRQILANSKTPPIIIIQGDHGPWLQPKERRLTILNAYYLPGHADAVSEFITPVNTFRLVYDLYLGGDFKLLPNVSYFSPVPKHFNFQAVPNRCTDR